MTAATFTAAARGFAAGDEDRMALGPLHDAARTALARRVRRGGRAAAGRASSTVVGDDGTALRGLPYRLRIVLALQFHDHLPPDEIAEALGTDEAGAERAVREASAAFLAAAGPGPRAGDGAGGGTGDERLCDLFGSLTARPGDAFAARLRDRVHEEARAVPLPVARVPAVPAGSAAAAASATSTEAGALASPAGAAAGVDGPPRALAGVARAAGPSPTVGPDAPAGTGTDPGADAPVEGLGDDDLPRTFSPARLGSAGGRARVRTGLSPRVWGLPAVIATAAVLLALVVTGGGGGAGRDRAAAPPVPRADPGGGGSRTDVVDGPESRLVDAVPLAPPATVGGERPAPTNTAEVVARVRLGPGGPYMNGPYALDAGAEGLWAAAVDDDGTWSAVRVDPASGETLAADPHPRPHPVRPQRPRHRGQRGLRVDPGPA